MGVGEGPGDGDGIRGYGGVVPGTDRLRQAGGVPQQPKPWEPGATTRQRVAPLVAAVFVVAAVVYALLPFTFAGVVECTPPLTGSSAHPDTPAGAVVGNPDEACAARGGTRLVNAGVVAAAAIVIGVAGAVLPSERPPPEGEDGDAGGQSPNGGRTGSPRS